MYKLILSWRYLRTRWIALASIVSVMLGVATMIVVNSVMEGFATEMQNRIHGILSDVVVGSRSMTGMPDAEWHMEKIREIAGDDIAGMTPTVIVPAMLNFRYNGEWITRQIQLIGIDPETQGQVSDFSEYLQHPENRESMSFALRESGYEAGGGKEGLGSPRRPQMEDAGWKHRRRMAELERFERRLGLGETTADEPPPTAPAEQSQAVPAEQSMPDLYPGPTERPATDRQPPSPEQTSTEQGPESGRSSSERRRSEHPVLRSEGEPERPSERSLCQLRAESGQVATDSQVFRVEVTPRLFGPLEPPKQGAEPSFASAQTAPHPSDHFAGGLDSRSSVRPAASIDVAMSDVAPTEDSAVYEAEAPPTRNAPQSPDAHRAGPADPFAARDEATGRTYEFDPATEQHTGVVLGVALAAVRLPKGEDGLLLLPGDDVKITFPTAGTPPKGVTDTFTVVDFYESKMSEYDSSFVFVPIDVLQDLRGMIDPATGLRMISSIQIKLREGADGNAVRDKLRAAFDPHFYTVETWRDKQGPLLQAVEMERAILNVLLFLIIAVAGFGILAIFLMIVVEKTRDIGILKSLGASGGGVMGIFLAYGLSLGVVGSGVGTLLGLVFVWNINEIADLLGTLTGRPVFDPSIYYFYQIPTIIEPWTIVWIVLGALTIAVLASVLPAMRAATLHPVEALRYE